RPARPHPTHSPEERGVHTSGIHAGTLGNALQPAHTHDPVPGETLQKGDLRQNAYTIVPHTSKAITAVNCGIYPHLTSKITEASPGGIPAMCLPRLLTGQGYDTVAFQSATGTFEDRGPLDRNFGYEQFFPLEKLPDKQNFEKVNYFGREDDIMLKPSERWIEEHRGRPFMMYYLGVTGHDNYLPIHRYGFKHYTANAKLNRYLNDVNYSDHFVHNVIDLYRRLGIYRNTIFVIYGDHGEGFGEHGLYQHDDTIYQEGLRIPLMILDPGGHPKGRVVTTPTDELDILPTVVQLLGYRIEGGRYQGRSMLAPPEPHRTLYFSCWDDYTCLASIKDGMKYIYFFGNKPEEVYDLSTDPYERHDIAARVGRAWLDERRAQVKAWFSRINAMYEQNTPASYR
ncbi:MAG: LTA synthase family protein, partial [Rubrobacteraceae bacterium]|nr:LTA synthase family protein [Rubrobacteraceae bacterium]